MVCASKMQTPFASDLGSDSCTLAQKKSNLIFAHSVVFAEVHATLAQTHNICVRIRYGAARGLNYWLIKSLTSDFVSQQFSLPSFPPIKNIKRSVIQVNFWLIIFCCLSDINGRLKTLLRGKPVTTDLCGQKHKTNKPDLLLMGKSVLTCQTVFESSIHLLPLQN